MFQFPSDLALEYWEHGYTVIPTRGKVPTIDDWAQRYTEGQSRADVEKLFRFHLGNAAILLGTVGPDGLYNAAIDVDNPGLFNAWRDRLSSTWLVSSYRGGHAHIKSATPIVPFKSSAYEIRSTGQLLTVPISRGKKGKPYINITDPDTVATVGDGIDLSFLPQPLEYDHTPIIGVHAATVSKVAQYTRKPLTRFALDMMAGMIDADKYNQMRRDRGQRFFDESRSALDMGLMLSLVSCGLGFDECADLFTASQHFGKFAAMVARSDKYEDLKPHNALKHALHYLRQTYDSALEVPEAKESRFALTVADAIELRIARSTWTGATGLTDKATLRGIAQLVRKTHAIDLHIGRRTMAELGQISQQTATNSLRRHAAAGLIERSATPKKVDTIYIDSATSQRVTVSAVTPNRYTVNLSAFTPELSALANGDAVAVASNSDRYCGVFEQSSNNGLGRMARSVYECLARSPKTQQEIGLETGHSRKSIVYALKVLTAYGLAFNTEHNDGQPQEGHAFYDCMANLVTELDAPAKKGKGRRSAVYIANTAVAWHDLAQKLGTTTVADQRRARHERETEAYKERISQPVSFDRPAPVVTDWPTDN